MHGRHARRANLRSAMILAVLTIAPIAAHAAGFDCTKAASPTEKAICADPGLSSLDGQLAAAWKKALAKGGDTAALKAAQLQWLKQRDRCGNDVLCVGDRYRERLASLNGASLAADRWQQTWYRDSDNPSFASVLTFTGTAPRLHFELSGNNGANTGGLSGDIELHGDRGTFRQDRCRLDFSRKGGRMQVAQQGGDVDCGAGSGVTYAGDYVTASEAQARPPADLVTLKVLTDARQNAVAHKLLGADYQTLVDMINVSADEKDLDGLNANATAYWVRGIATTNAAIVMHRGTDLWIGLLVFDAHDQVRMRYYSNVPAWKKTVPKTIRAWHDKLDKTLPIDLM
ncbi:MULTISPECIES: lysozyme inhibitor LprI family protein [unclassified Burkholderia]|uniref:lysozyme inhibitor LprI family protein n=1 Tax=unclassified Burkholderia TaxID=2613784 RepID=UPI001E29F5FC|nr:MULTISPECIES: lysozyme inhibitor LprI family protein [unclassified Burkholderia]UEP33164.1 lysozyme inhibitor LprI family protein [Burkholderia sp. B21-007]UEP46659.1 lysozyme inhibitor LprI family protein [Burkholderia sp. B21-005]